MDLSILNEFSKHVYQVAEEHGFHENPDFESRFGDFCSNLHGEVSELWEAYRKHKLYNPCDKDVPLTCAEEELADIAIRVFDLAATMNIDISRAISLKDKYNQTRPFKHGGKAA